MIVVWLQALRTRLLRALFGVNGVVEIERGSTLIVERNGRPLAEAEKARLAMLAVRAGVNVVVLEEVRLRGFVPPERLQVMVSQTADDLARSFTHHRPDPTTLPPGPRARSKK